MGRKFAILIGVETYDDADIVPVAYAAADVLGMGEVLKEVCRFDVIHRLCRGGDAAPTFNNISSLLEDLAKELRAEDLLYFHGSAHGVEIDGRRYLLTQDTPRKRVSRGIPIADLHDWLDNCDALQRAFGLDICRDDPFKDRAGADNLMSDGLGRDIGALASNRPGRGDPTVAMLSACKPGQRAYGWERVQRGLLSHFLIERIKSSQGSPIDFDSLAEHATGEVIRWCGKDGSRKQTPWFNAAGPKRRIVLCEGTARVAVSMPPAQAPAPAPPASFDAEVGRVVKALKLQIDIDGPFTWDAYVGIARKLQSVDERDPKARQLLADAAAFSEGRLPATAFLAKYQAAPAGKTHVADLGGGVKMEFVRIEPGEFLMGSPAGEKGRSDDEFQHKVRLTKPFMLGIHPVTRGQFAALVNEAGYKTEAEKEGWAHAWTGEKWDKVNGASYRKPGFDQRDDHPAVCLSFNDATACCQWLSGKSRRRFRLPTEAEWEYSCRAGTTTPFHTGPTISTDQANYDGNYTYGKGVKGVYRKATTPVGFFKPNPWGLFDVHGNVWEWCADGYGEYPRRDVVDPAGDPAISSRVLRGGSWFHSPRNCRAACRSWSAPVYRGGDVGFRVCLDL